MKLLPIRARAIEGNLHVFELFFIDSSKFSVKYFLKSVLPLMPGTEKKELESLSEASTLRIYADMAMQIKRYAADIEKLQRTCKHAKISLPVDFKIAGYLSIEDRVCFTFPIKNEPELYARDLFQTYSIPEGELLAIFIFYIRESLLSCIKECINSPETMESPAQQQAEPRVQTSDIEKLNQSLLSYEARGKVVFLKEAPEKKRKKKQTLQASLQ